MAETRAFQAETQRLLDLLAHSLYQSKDVALRELVSNASDALDKWRREALVAGRDAGPLEILLEADAAAGTLTVADTGIGMTKDELAANLGTIAKSGTREYVGQLDPAAAKEQPLIGQFGVGFYASFMLAGTVRVESRSHAAAEPGGWRWTSTGADGFTLEPCEFPGERGTRIVLTLKPELAKEYADPAALKRILRQYSGFLAHPIKVNGELVNDVKPIWTEPKGSVTDERHEAFFQHLTHRSAEKPLWWLHLSIDTPLQFHAALYCPPTNPESLGFGRMEQGIHLCHRRALVQAECTTLLPGYLRFLVGVVDAEDLALNVSRETLQDSAPLRKIRTVLVKRTLDRLLALAGEAGAQYRKFHDAFGMLLREGVHEEHDADLRTKLAKLLRFASTKEGSEGEFVGLDDYVARMPEGQSRIYFAVGPDLAALRGSPSLEILRQRGYEALLLTNPLDEFVLGELDEFAGKRITAATAADLGLPDDPTAAQPEAPARFDELLAIVKEALGTQVQDVRASQRLSGSPACLVAGADGMSPQLERLLRQANREFVGAPRVLELNPQAPLVRRLAELAANPDCRGFVADCGKQLHANALALEGQVPDPVALVERVQALMAEAAAARSPIVT